MAWTADEILDANPAEAGQAASKLERLAKSAQLNLDILADVADELERREVPHVAALFQLPYPVSTGDAWHRVPTGTHGVHAEVRCEVCQVEMRATDEFRLLRMRTGREGQSVPMTQGVALFPLWTPHSQFYERYLTHAYDPKASGATIVPQGPSWIDNRPITTSGFGHDIARRLLREVIPVLRCLLPAYSIASIAETPVPKRVFGYMAMTAPGLMRFAGDSVSVIGGIFDRVAAPPPAAHVDAGRMSAAMRTRYRDFGSFEAQLFALERLRSQGEVALALIGSLSLLEWLLNRFIRGLGGKKSNLDGLIKDQRVTFLSDAEKQLLDTARDARNKSVHGEPPARGSLTTGTPAAGREIEGLSARLSAADVRQVIELVFKAYREVNLLGSRIPA
jgi:hypothetical protein